MKKRINKKTSLLVMMFVCLFAVVSIGSAAWLLIGEDTEELTGNISVDTVDDQRHVITVNTENKDLDVTLVPGSGEVDKDWLKYEPKAELEKDFDAYVEFTVSNPATAEVSVSVKLGTEVSALVEDGILSVVVKYEDTTLSLADGVYSKKETLDASNNGGNITITFSWGATFNELLNSTDGSATYGETGKSVSDNMLTALQSLQALNGKKVADVTIKTSNTYNAGA